MPKRNSKAKKLNYRTFLIRLKCEDCRTPLPLGGPVRELKCFKCHKIHELEPRDWAELLSDVTRPGAKNSFESSHRYACYTTLSKDGHHCPQCDDVVDVSRFSARQERTQHCEHCSFEIASFPPPDWLADELPDLVQIINVPGHGGAESEAEESVVMACPKCGGTLELDGESRRTEDCPSCGANVYLPDSLWERLHPELKVRPWTVVYDADQLVVATPAEDKVRAEESIAHPATADDKVRAEESIAHPATADDKVLAEEPVAHPAAAEEPPVRSRESSTGEVRLALALVAGVCVLGAIFAAVLFGLS